MKNDRLLLLALISYRTNSLLNDIYHICLITDNSTKTKVTFISAVTFGQCDIIMWLVCGFFAMVFPAVIGRA